MGGKEILDSIRQLLRFYRDCTLLLKTGEASLEEAGWRNVSGNTAISNLSKSIEYPDYWSPYYAFRFFENDRHKTRLAFLSVIFDLPEEPELIREPLVVAGWLDFEDDKVGVWEYWYATLHMWMPNRRDDGTLLSLDPRKEWPDEGYKMSRLTTLAIPLISISNAQHLNERVVRPLLDGIAKSTA